MKNNFQALILAGGIGTRLWPKSRRHRPKQFLKIQSEVSLLVRTIERAEAIFPPENIWILCKPYHLQEVSSQLPDIPSGNILVEPSPKGTGAAIIYGALLIEEMRPGSTVTVFPSDHIIKPVAEFKKSIEAGMEWAFRHASVVIFGIRPSRPETSYGYIEAGRTVDQCKGHKCMEVTAFHEKPDRRTALAYIGSKRYLWNSGMVSFHVPELRNALDLNAFSIWHPLLKLAAAKDFLAEQRQTRKLYSTLPEDAFDTAVLEKIACCHPPHGSAPPVKLVVFPCSFDWHDMGVWESYYELAPKDENGNALVGKAVELDCRGVLMLSEGPNLVTAIGVSDMVIVSEGDAILICPRAQLDRVRDLVEELREKGYEKFT
ncbi:MAG: hypothetical protein DSZ23_03840 [Thermodesulfatator sp.]|nr:MAG: hypothetical protein DSZ23_03840 [Thermodesulfatator sp.]